MMKIVCLEGISNAGKTSLCEELINMYPSWIWINRLQKEDYVLNKLSEITHPIENQGLFDEKTEVFLYLSILSQKASRIEEFKDKDKVVLVDRFSLSVFSYLSQIYKNTDFLSEAIKIASRNIIPDLTILLDVSIDSILSRANKSPLSRKDIGILDNYLNITNTFHSFLPTYTSHSIIFTTDETSIAEMAKEIRLQIEKV